MSAIPDGVYKVHQHLSEVLEKLDLVPDQLAEVGKLAQQIGSGEKSVEEVVVEAPKIKPGAEKIFQISGYLIPILVACIAAWAVIYAAKITADSTKEAAEITAKSTIDAAEINAESAIEAANIVANANEALVSTAGDVSGIPIPQSKPKRKKSKGKHRAGQAKAKRKKRQR